jgi:acetyltransferase-like isoleucine patch superfamily enzyme
MAQRIASTAVIHPGVVFGDDVVVEDFCVVGCPPRGAEPGELVTRIGDGAVIRSHTVIYAGNVIGAGFQTGNKANLRESNEIGDRVSVGTLSVVEHHVRIGSGVRIHTQVFVPEYTVLEDGCWLGPNVVLTNAKYPQSPGVKDELRGAVVRRGAIVGANATLLPGIVVGERALIGAGSVVTRNVEPGGVWAGNPARQIKSLQQLPYGPSD